MNEGEYLYDKLQAARRALSEFQAHYSHDALVLGTDDEFDAWIRGAIRLWRVVVHAERAYYQHQRKQKTEVKEKE